MRSEGIYEINGVQIEILKSNYYPSAREKQNPGWEGWSWSILDANGNRTGLKEICSSPEEALSKARLEIENESLA